MNVKNKIAGFLICATSILPFTPARVAHADLFGGDVAVLAQILVQAIEQVYKLREIVGKATETVEILEEMNRGVKEVLRLAETAHIALPPRAYEQAKKIDQAAQEAVRIYGKIPNQAPVHAKMHYKSGIEALSLSQDAFDYSTFMDKQGERIKSAAIVSSQATATRLTAESMGVLLHSVNQTNRLQAKSLEISSSDRIEESAKENAKYEDYQITHAKFEKEIKHASFSALNSVGNHGEF